MGLIRSGIKIEKKKNRTQREKRRTDESINKKKVKIEF